QIRLYLFGGGSPSFSWAIIDCDSRAGEQEPHAMVNNRFAFVPETILYDRARSATSTEPQSANRTLAAAELTPKPSVGTRLPGLLQYAHPEDGPPSCDRLCGGCGTERPSLRFFAVARRPFSRRLDWEGATAGAGEREPEMVRTPFSPG